MKFHKEVLSDVWMQFFVLCLLMALSVDSLNPIKAISGFLGVPSFYWGFLYFIMMLMLIWNNLADVIYRSTCVFLHSVLSISFKSIEVVGLDNIPKEGPVIFTGNHTNQFVDALVVMMMSPRKVGFLIAEKSWHRPVIGDFSRIMGCIPVVRPQDSVLKGVGQVKLANPTDAALEKISENDDDAQKKEYVLVGEGTSFTAQVTPGDQVRYQGKSVKDSGSPVKIVKVISDTELLLDAPFVNGNDVPVFEFSTFGILKKVDQSVTFAKVYTHLKRGNSIGIFPEGGSHDRTDLLPLKAGVAIMALGAKDKYNINAHVVPVGLTYFRGHRFRGRVTVEFGTPVVVDDAMMKLYEKDKREACNTFLHRVEDGMRSVIVTAPNYNIMQLIFAARRLFQRSGVRLSAKDTLDLNRRFAEGYKILSTIPEASKDLEDLQKKLDEYNKTLKLMGLKDHQVPYIAWWRVHDVIGSALYGFLIFALASIPSFVLNAPVGLLARSVAMGEQRKALEGSKVKVAARDVLLSKKIQFSMVAVPVLWLIYLLAAILFTDWYWSSIVLLLASFPLFSFFGVRSVEAGIIELKTVRPLFYRLLPSHRKIQDELPQKRADLQKEVRKFVKKYKTQLGKLAEPVKMDWHEYMHSVAVKDAEASLATKAITDGEKSSPGGTDDSSEDDETVMAVRMPPTTITKDHDLSILKKSDKSVLDLASLERSMSCPPGFQEVLEKQEELERLKEGRSASTADA
uniref:Phospholipid/glycerol acyltransferase domain-containing protein n=1 Tax=Globisporangium ultimum (strain ATCC 200006 / CBS 805.95 / DAOM BR144) TaxID=431595 RepID=K3WVL3_GLOUD